MTENDHFRTLLALAECNQRYLLGIFEDNHSGQKQDLRAEIKERKAAELLLSLKFEKLQKTLKEQRKKKPKNWNKR